MPLSVISGKFHLLSLYDVGDEIHLQAVCEILGLPPAGREPSFRQPAPEYVRFEQPPVIEIMDRITLRSGERLEGAIKYYDYGVVSVEFELGFELSWEDLVLASSRWFSEPEVEAHAKGVVLTRLEKIQAAVVKPYSRQLSEDYYMIHVNNISHEAPSTLTAAELIETYGDQIAMLVRGESKPLSRDEKREVLQSTMSYYPNDLVVVGWSAAFLFDSLEGAAPIIELLEYANSQLLEFRHYDNLLTRVLSEVYRSLDKGTGFLRRWRLAGEAQRLNTIRLDVIELTERVDNSIKFLSDMFSARLYRLAAAKVGVPDYRRLVDAKLATAGELYEFMMDAFRQGRSFVLELLVLIILIVELLYLFRH